MQNGKIAIIDDEPLLIRILSDLLERAGLEVDPFSSGQEAVLKIIPQLSKYACVITDFDMPDVSGLELASKIREVSFDLPIVVCSGDRNMLDEDELVRLRINAVLKKPFTKNELYRCLNELIDIQIYSN